MTMTLLAFVRPLDVYAQTADGLTALTRYLPQGMVSITLLRTDAAFIEAGDTLIDDLEKKSALATYAADSLFTENLVRELTLHQQPAVPDFVTEIRPWLGNSAAWVLPSDYISGVYPQPYIFAVEVTDHAAAQAFIERQLGLVDDGLIETQTINGGLLYLFEPKSEDESYFYDPAWTEVLLLDDALFVGSGGFITKIAKGDFAPMNEMPRFNNTLAVLPLPIDSYSGLVYFDEQAIVRGYLVSQGADPADFSAIVDAFGGFVAGMGALDGDGQPTLLVDLAQHLEDVGALEALGFQFTPLGAVDSAFAARIPDQTPLAILHHDLWLAYQHALKNNRVLSELQEDLDYPVAYTPSEEDIAYLVNELLWLFRDTTGGLELGAEIQPWMSGDYALVLGYGGGETAAYLDSGMFGVDIPIAFGLIFDSSADAPAAADYVGTLETQLASQIEAVGATLTTETVAGAEALVISVPKPDSGLVSEVLIAANADVFVIGTREVVETALSGTNTDALLTNAIYAAAQSVLLDNYDIHWYIGVDDLVTLANADKSGMGSYVADLADVFDSFTLSAAPVDGGNWRARLTVTLAE